MTEQGDESTSSHNSGDKELLDPVCEEEVLPLSLLFKFIKPFNGDRKELTTFIQNCNSAFKLAQPNQNLHLFLFVASQLSSSVVNEINLEEIRNWKDLKDKLKNYYSRVKDLTQLHEELETIKQNFNESVTDFFKRLETLKNECITAETNDCEEKNELFGLKKSIQRTALRRFILHCRPEISQMLRARDIKTLNEAFSMALQEEKILSYTKSQNKSSPTQFCSFCKRNNHTTQNCRQNLELKINQISGNQTQITTTLINFVIIVKIKVTLLANVEKDNTKNNIKIQIHKIQMHFKIKILKSIF